MSVHKIAGVRGPTFEVRWRPHQGPQKSRRFKNEDEAERFDEAMRAHVALQRAQRRWESCPVEAREAVIEWEAGRNGDRGEGS
jgi:hypothetical protein